MSRRLRTKSTIGFELFCRISLLLSWTLEPAQDVMQRGWLRSGTRWLP